MILASNNKGKLEEIRKILDDYKIYSLKEKNIDVDVIEDQDTFFGNAKKKAMEIYDIAQEPTIADDSGLCIDCLNGFPGVMTHRFLGENATLLVVEGNSAMGGMAQARDYTKYGLMAIRGKIINCLSNPEEKIFQNEEIKLLLSALNITPGRYNANKLRYGRLAICTDADSDK
mgnify:CR=1 FL=1